MIITTSATAGNAKVGNIWGDLLCISAQLSFALYLALFKPLVQKYSLFTVNKWMFTWATLLIWPFYIWSYHKHQLRHRTNEHMVGDGVRYILRYLPGIHLYDDGTKDVAAYCGKRVQLCAAYCVGKRKRSCGPCRI